MLIELYLLRTYFAEQFTALYEQDLIGKYGPAAVSEAIEEGILEHRRIPCGRGRERCVCRLSEKGIAIARNEVQSYEISTVFYPQDLVA